MLAVTENARPGAGLLGRHERPLAWHLTVLCLALVVPLLGLAGVLAWFYAGTEQDRIEHEALQIAREVTAVTDRELAGLVATTEVLSLSRYLQSDDLEGFDAQARVVYRRLGVNVVVRDRNSQQVVNTRVPRGQPLPVNVDVESDQRALQTGRPVVSNLFTGGVTRRPLFIVNVPVTRAGEVIYFLNLSLEPERIRDLFAGIDLPKKWTAIVADRRGAIVAHSSRQELMVGRQLPKSIWNEAGGGEDITSGANGLSEGEPVMIALSRSSYSGWLSVVTVPAAEVSAPLRRSLLGLGGAGALMLALSVGLAVVFARRIARPVAGLAVRARRLGRGEPFEQLSTPVREVNVLSLALSTAARERGEAEAALRTSEERLRLAQAAGRIGSWDWDAQNDRMICSETYCRLYGLDPAGPGHESQEAWLAQVHRDDRDRALASRQAAVASGRFEGEYRIVRPDGSVHWISDRGVPMHDGEGHLVRLIGASVDVTETRAAAETVRELQFELLHSSRLSAMGQMAAELAHELNQPLGAATNFLGAARLALKGAGPGASASALERIEKASEQTVRAGAILRRLRDFIGRRETEKQIVSARRLVEDAVALALVGVRDPKLRVRFDFDPRADDILADSIQIQQVVFNLVRNALEATQASEPREIVLSTRPADEGAVEISVADTGPGLPPDPETLFRPFTTSKPNGMGLGLSICRAIVEAHHGRLWAEPRAGGGAVFRFVVPAAHRAEANDA